MYFRFKKIYNMCYIFVIFPEILVNNDLKIANNHNDY